MQAASFALLVVEYCKDFWRFLRYGKGSPLAPLDRRGFYNIILFVHTIEKGLSLSNPRPFFGKQNFRLIAELVEEYPEYGSPFPIRMAKTAYIEYLEFHKKRALEDPFLEEVRAMLKRFDEKFPTVLPFDEGMRNVTEIFANVEKQQLSYPDFIKSRFSCRSYAPSTVPMELISKIVKIAQAAPSQCNRQSPKLHLYQDEEMIQSLLTIQGGTRGFSQEVKNLFVVASEITAWSASSARNQDYIDGSLFAMNLMLSLHAHGLAACPLNIAFRNQKEKQLRRAGNIPDSQRLLMMISFGYPNKNVGYAASSPRQEIAEVLIVH